MITTTIRDILGYEHQTTGTSVADQIKAKETVQFEGEDGPVYIPYHAIEQAVITRTIDQKPKDYLCESPEDGCDSLYFYAYLQNESRIQLEEGDSIPIEASEIPVEFFVLSTPDPDDDDNLPLLISATASNPSVTIEISEIADESTTAYIFLNDPNVDDPGTFTVNVIKEGCEQTFPLSIHIG